VVAVVGVVNDASMIVKGSMEPWQNLIERASFEVGRNGLPELRVSKQPR
jgi:hypothetical protein